MCIYVLMLCVRLCESGDINVIRVFTYVSVMYLYTHLPCACMGCVYM